MSEHMLRWVLVATAVMMVGAPVTTAAQQTKQEREQALGRHLDSIMPLLAQARSAAEAEAARREEEARRRSAPVTDTFTVGPMRIVTLPSQRAMAESLFREVWDREYAPFVSSSPSLARMQFTFEWATPIEPIYVNGDVRRVEIARWRPRSVVLAGIRQAISTTLVADLGETHVAQWTSQPVAAASDGAQLYLTMVGNSLSIDRRCLGGEADACWHILGLGLGLGSRPMGVWYTPQERRALVGEIGVWSVPSSFSEKEKALWSACVHDGVQASCDSILGDQPLRTRYPRAYMLSPLPAGQGRAQMIWLALKAGGHGAWDRLREHPEMSAEEALAYASGLTREQLALRWQQWITTQRPPARATLDPSLLFTLLWVGLLAALAMRNTRWRLG